MCVTRIQATAGLSQSTVSSYMSTLERAGLVRPTRMGKWTHHRRDEGRPAEPARAIGTTL
ncbi:ArsR/SmtB family transcription factor [Streptomyces massasporeus]|uniref:ArsR/SmtB family transcription factor n=1 Tax=Streptomyces massasporeus TaxID=67324 RepID=UPI0019BEE79E|nr:hypothetical protein GCM10010228_13070 [Streptomyces massasporeus]